MTNLLAMTPEHIAEVTYSQWRASLSPLPPQWEELDDASRAPIIRAARDLQGAVRRYLEGFERPNLITRSQT